MKAEAAVTINASKEIVWRVITDFEQAEQNISAIEKLEILEQPADGLVGFRWRETRKMFGKSATEEMWITDVSDNQSYTAQAESHGCRYISVLEIEEHSERQCSLTMSFEGQALSALAKLMMIPMGWLMKRSTTTMILNDLNDLKVVAEGMQDTGRPTGE